MTLYDQFLGYLEDQLAVKRCDVTLDSRLDDLGLDSLDKVKFGMWIDEQLGTQLLETTVEALHTVRDVVELMKSKQGGSPTTTMTIKPEHKASTTPSAPAQFTEKWECRVCGLPCRIFIQYESTGLSQIEGQHRFVRRNVCVAKEATTPKWEYAGKVPVIQTT